MSTVPYLKQIGPHLYSARPFHGARAESSVRVLSQETQRIYNSRLGLQEDSFAREVNRDAFLKIREALIDADYISVQVNSTGPYRALTTALWEEIVAVGDRMAVIAWVGCLNFAPEILPIYMADEEKAGNAD